MKTPGDRPSLAHIFKGAVVQDIQGRRVCELWTEMQALPKSGRLDLSPLITERIPMGDFEQGMELLLSGNASKVLMYPNGIPEGSVKAGASSSYTLALTLSTL